MAPVDPSYPLLPVASFIAVLMMLLVLLTSFMRQSWNLGVAFLCFWLFIENVANGVNFIAWSDNTDVKFLVYCDIVSRLQLVTFVVKPMATFLISRRLYIITSLQSVDFPGEKARRWNLFVEWTLGLFIPLLVAGPIYYINQYARFQIQEGSGCGNAAAGSGFYMLTIQSWSVIPPLLSVAIYFPRVACILYKQRRDVDHFLHSNNSVTRTNYIRLFALASIDVLLTLPFGIVSTVLVITAGLAQHDFPFYPGWAVVHANWKPVRYSYADLQSQSTLAGIYFSYWSSPVLTFSIFALFGLTSEARTTYWRITCSIGRRVGCKPSQHVEVAHQSRAIVGFGVLPQDVSSISANMGSRSSFVNVNKVQAKCIQEINRTGEKSLIAVEACDTTPSADATGEIGHPPGDLLGSSSRGESHCERDDAAATPINLV